MIYNLLLLVVLGFKLTDLVAMFVFRFHMGSLFPGGAFKIERVGTGSMLGGVQGQNNESITYVTNERTTEIAVSFIIAN